MIKTLFGKVDRFYVAYVTLIIIALVIGAICGIILAGMGIAAYFELIDIGELEDDIGAPWLILGGLGITFGASLYIGSVKEKREKVRHRIKQNKNLQPKKNIAR
jgi:predicted membrane channel-forming protein YqfA (hemolysin III family)